MLNAVWAFVGALIGGLLHHFGRALVDGLLARATAVERQRERVLVDLTQALHRLSESGERYWNMNAADDPALDRLLAARIVADLQMVNSFLPDLFETGTQQLKNSKAEWQHLHRALTSGDFCSRKRTHDAAALATAALACREMETGVKRRREQLRRPLFAQR